MLRRREATYPAQHPDHNVGCHCKKVGHNLLLPALDLWLRDFAQGEKKAIRIEIFKVLPKATEFIYIRV